MSKLRPARVVDQTVDRLRARILERRHLPGDRLPPERQLAEDLGINRLTLRSALSRLESEGLVEPRHGDGVRVLDYRSRANVTVLSHLMRGPERLLAIRSFLELWRIVGAEAVALACRRAKPEQLAALEALVEAQESESDPAAFAERDLQIGRSILRCADNLAFELVLNSVEGVYRQQRDLLAALHGDLDVVRASYRVALKLIRAGDADNARRTIRTALETIDEAALRRLARGAGR